MILKNASTFCKFKKPSFDGFFCILVLWLLFGGGACKKKEVEKPTLVLSAPMADQQFRVLDTLVVKGMAADAVGLTSIEVQLVDADGNPCSSRVQEKGSGTEMRFSIALPLDKAWIPSGNYQIEVVARNTSEFTRKWLSVSIQEIPRALDDAWLISSSGPSFRIQRFSAQALDAPVFSGTGTWLTGHYFPKAGVWVHATNNSIGQGLVEAFEIKPSWRLVWSRSFMQPIRSALATDSLMLLGFDNALVVGLKPDGTTGVSTYSLLDGYQTKALVAAPYGGVAALAQASPPYTLAGFRVPSGQKLASTTISAFPKWWLNQSINKAYWVSGNGTTESLSLLDCTNLQLQPIAELPGITTAVAVTTQGDLALSFSDALWVYRINSQVLAPFAALQQATLIRHENLLNQFWVVNAAGIHRVSFPQGTIAGPYPGGNNIVDFVFQYNK